MNTSPNLLRAIEFDRIVAIVAGLAITPTGRTRLEALRPQSDIGLVTRTQKATSEGARFLAIHPGFPLRAPSDLEQLLEDVNVEGRPLEPLRLLALADYLESIEHARNAVRHAGGSFAILEQLVSRVASFTGEIAEVRRQIEPSGDVADDATPRLAAVRERLRKQRARLRQTLESLMRGRETAKYLQEQVVTDRNGRYVLTVRAEHRAAIRGIVHGASASGASLFVEPLETVDINNEIVALEEEEAEEIHRILVALTDRFRKRPDDLRTTTEVATELDAIQARARFSQLVQGTEPVVSGDDTFELRNARHPLLIPAVGTRAGNAEPRSSYADPVPVDILLTPPTRVLVITGPNTGGKTVALKTAGLLAAMAQAGLHIPADAGSQLPIFRSMFADIGDDQSIAASLSTFSGHITNIVAMDRNLARPALVLLDEIGAGTDPAEGGALGIAVIDHFRRRGAHLVATTHYDSLKSYASTTEGVTCAAFGFNPEGFAPTYRLVYGSPGRSLAIEIAARLGMPASVIAAARENLTEGEKQLADHLAQVDDRLRTIERERSVVHRERAALADIETRLRAREAAVHEREEALRRRVKAKIDDQVRAARAEIDAVIDSLKERAAELSDAAARQLAEGLPRLRRPVLTTGDTGAARADARSALDRIAAQVTADAAPAVPSAEQTADGRGPIEVGSRVVGPLGQEGTVIALLGHTAEVDIRGKRFRTQRSELRLVGGPAAPRVRVNVDLQPRDTSHSELNVVGCTVDEAIGRVEKFLDEAMVTDLRSLRIIHGHGTGQLRRAIADLLRGHPLVAHFERAPQNQGGGGATVVELKD